MSLVYVASRETMILLNASTRMDWDQLKKQLEGTVKQEAVKALDAAIERLQQLRAEYVGDLPSPPAEPESLFSPDEQRTQATRTPDFWSPERTTARSQTQQERREREKQETSTKPPQLEPRTCMVCRQAFTPTHHLQKKCEPCRTAAAAQSATPKPAVPRTCSGCGQGFTPTHGLQKKCEHCRNAVVSKKINAINLDEGLTPEEKDWKRYGEAVASKLAKRSDAPVMPGRF